MPGGVDMGSGSRGPLLGLFLCDFFYVIFVTNKIIKIKIKKHYGIII